jgi:hypothetical protein
VKGEVVSAAEIDANAGTGSFFSLSSLLIISVI